MTSIEKLTAVFEALEHAKATCSPWARAEADKAISYRDELMKAFEWQPIESAPKEIPIDVCGYVGDRFCRHINVVIEKKSKERIMIHDGWRPMPATHWMMPIKLPEREKKP